MTCTFHARVTMARPPSMRVQVIVSAVGWPLTSPHLRKSICLLWELCRTDNWARQRLVFVMQSSRHKVRCHRHAMRRVDSFGTSAWHSGGLDIYDPSFFMLPGGDAADVRRVFSATFGMELPSFDKEVGPVRCTLCVRRWLCGRWITLSAPATIVKPRNGAGMVQMSKRWGAGGGRGGSQTQRSHGHVYSKTFLRL